MGDPRTPGGIPPQAFRLQQLLGTGSFAEVWQGMRVLEPGATASILPPSFAVKTYKAKFLRDEQHRRMVDAEIAIMARLRHPHIVRLFYAQSSPRGVSLAMELATRGSLYALVRKQKRLREEQAKLLFAQVASAVLYLHRKAIAHRDIKLENLLFFPSTPSASGGGPPSGRGTGPRSAAALDSAQGVDGSASDTARSVGASTPRSWVDALGTLKLIDFGLSADLTDGVPAAAADPVGATPASAAQRASPQDSTGGSSDVRSSDAHTGTGEPASASSAAAVQRPKKPRRAESEGPALRAHAANSLVAPERLIAGVSVEDAAPLHAGGPVHGGFGGTLEANSLELSDDSETANVGHAPDPPSEAPSATQPVPPRGERLLHMVCGSLMYTAPEILEHQPYLGRPVDVWSLGVLLYACVVGAFPFNARTEQEVRRKIARAVPDVPPWVSPPLADLLRRMLSRDALARPTMEEIVVHPWLAEPRVLRLFSDEYCFSEERGRDVSLAPPTPPASGPRTVTPIPARKPATPRQRPATSHDKGDPGAHAAAPKTPRMKSGTPAGLSAAPPRSASQASRSSATSKPSVNSNKPAPVGSRPVQAARASTISATAKTVAPRGRSAGPARDAGIVAAKGAVRASSLQARPSAKAAKDTANTDAQVSALASRALALRLATARQVPPTSAAGGTQPVPPPPARIAGGSRTPSMSSSATPTIAARATVPPSAATVTHRVRGRSPRAAGSEPTPATLSRALGLHTAAAGALRLAPPVPGAASPASKKSVTVLTPDRMRKLQQDSALIVSRALHAREKTAAASALAQHLAAQHVAPPAAAAPAAPSHDGSPAPDIGADVTLGEDVSSYVTARSGGAPALPPRDRPTSATSTGDGAERTVKAVMDSAGADVGPSAPPAIAEEHQHMAATVDTGAVPKASTRRAVDPSPGRAGFAPQLIQRQGGNRVVDLSGAYQRSGTERTQVVMSALIAGASPRSALAAAMGLPPGSVVSKRVQPTATRSAAQRAAVALASKPASEGSSTPVSAAVPAHRGTIKSAAGPLQQRTRPSSLEPLPRSRPLQQQADAKRSRPQSSTPGIRASTGAPTTSQTSPTRSDAASVAPASASSVSGKPKPVARVKPSPVTAASPASGTAPITRGRAALTPASAPRVVVRGSARVQTTAAPPAVPAATYLAATPVRSLHDVSALTATAGASPETDAPVARSSPSSYAAAMELWRRTTIGYGSAGLHGLPALFAAAPNPTSATPPRPLAPPVPLPAPPSQTTPSSSAVHDEWLL